MADALCKTVAGRMRWIVLFLCLVPTACCADVFYVAANGRANMSGRLPAPNAQGSDGPLDTLEAARNAIRAARKNGAKGPFKVQVRGGVYRLERTFVLGPEDSGDPQSPVVYEARPGERVVISGARAILNWKKADQQLWTATVPIGWRFRQMFVNARRAQRARTPNHGYFRVMGPSSQDALFRLPYRGVEILKSWQGMGVEVVALLGWTAFRRPILTVDESKAIATLAGNSGGSAVGKVQDVDGRYFIENAPEALDSPGEWFLDESRGEVRYSPLGGETPGRETILAPTLHRLVHFQGAPERDQRVHHVVLRNLEFRHADWVMNADGYADEPQAAVNVGAAIEMDGVEQCAIQKCSFSQNGGYAVWARRGARRNRIAGNHIFDMGAGGIKIGEGVLRTDDAEQSESNEVTDNYVHDLGQVYPEAVGIWVGHSGHNLISHNRIHDVFYTGISVGWTWGYQPNLSRGNRIEFNHVYRIGKETLNDLGGIYLLGAHDGTTVRNNLIHDVTSFADRGRGLYLDEGSTGVLVENNIVYRCKSAGFHLHYGKDNVVRNNIFALNRDAQVSRGRAEAHHAFSIQGNIVYADRGQMLGGALNDDHFTFDRNLYHDARGEQLRFGRRTVAEWRAAGHDTHSTLADPLFQDPSRFDFTLRPGSPAFRLGFRNIDISTVGPRPGTLP